MASLRLIRLMARRRALLDEPVAAPRLPRVRLDTPWLTVALIVISAVVQVAAVGYLCGWWAR